MKTASDGDFGVAAARVWNDLAPDVVVVVVVVVNASSFKIKINLSVQSVDSELCRVLVSRCVTVVPSVIQKSHVCTQYSIIITATKVQPGTR